MVNATSTAQHDNSLLIASREQNKQVKTHRPTTKISDNKFNIMSSNKSEEKTESPADLNLFVEDLLDQMVSV
jgi:hypothetical protein